MSKRYVEGKLAPHESARAVENHAAHGKPRGEPYRKGWMERRDEARAYPPNRSMNGAGAKQNSRRNGRLVSKLADVHPLSGQPTARPETSAKAAVRWLDPTPTSNARVWGKGKGSAKSFRR